MNHNASECFSTFGKYRVIHRRRRNHAGDSRSGPALVATTIDLFEDRICPSALTPQAASATQLEVAPAGFTETVVASSLSGPTAMQFSPDGKLFIAEEAGTMEVWDGNVRLQANFFQNTPLTTQTVSERGLLGVAFDPDYENNRFVYVYYTTTAPDNHNRVSRFTADAAGELALAGSEQLVMELDPHSAGNHNGGALHFGNDDMLYIAVGDNANGSNSQSLANRHGKMLRIDVNGDDFADTGQNYHIPADNPTTFPGVMGSPTGVNRSIWAVGLRNPFTFSVQPGTGRIFINDVGQNTWEEINDGGAGLNFGWPTTEGGFDQASFPDFTQPFYTYDQGGDQPNGCAITGGAFYNPVVNQFPSEYQGDYFFADLCGNRIWHIDLTSGQVDEFASGLQSPVDLKVDGAGNLYYLSYNGGQVVRFSYVSQPPNLLNVQINGGGNSNRSGIRELTFTFSDAVTIDGAAALRLFNHSTGLGVDLSAAALLNNGTASVTWDLSGVALDDGRYSAELPADAATPGLTATHAFAFHKLAGDANGDGAVSNSDYREVNAHFGSVTGGAFRPGDANGDGVVSNSDYREVNGRFGTVLATLSLDFGDAPGAAAFPTTLADDGARHVLTANNLFLGASRDAETDGLSSATAGGDDAAGMDDENGLTIGDLERGSTVSVTVTANVPAGAVLNGWIDWNADGDWDDAGEQVFTNVPLSSGPNDLDIEVPAAATPGPTTARFRLTQTPGYSYFGLAPNGEVEDYQVAVTAPPELLGGLLAAAGESATGLSGAGVVPFFPQRPSLSALQLLPSSLRDDAMVGDLRDLSLVTSHRPSASIPFHFRPMVDEQSEQEPPASLPLSSQRSTPPQVLGSFLSAIGRLAKNRF